MTIQAIDNVTARIIKRSAKKRAAYLASAAEDRRQYESGEMGPRNDDGGCSNCAHAFAGSSAEDKKIMTEKSGPTIGIIDSGNDLISSGQPFERMRNIARKAAKAFGAVALVAGATPSMCDGLTQGYDGMDLSLFSRETIAQSAAIGTSGGTLDAALYYGDCDKIFPGLFQGSAAAAYLPTAYAPSGPMTSSKIDNPTKAKNREDFKQKKIIKIELQASENEIYHESGICTFLGTAHTNNILREVMGLALPGAALVNAGTELRDALTENITERLAKEEIAPLYEIIDEKSFVNAIVTLMAIGGSTNHTMHIPAMAAHMGIEITWDDLDEISKAVPLLARVYPNGPADVNDFQKAGGIPAIIEELRAAGMLHEDVNTILGQGLEKYTKAPVLSESGLEWKQANTNSQNLKVIASVDKPFSKEGGLNLLKGNLGRAMMKISAVKDEHRVVEGEAVVFDSQEELIEASQAWVNSTKEDAKLSEHEQSLADKFNAESLVVVVRGQSANHNGMPEQHKCIDALKIMQKKGKNVAFLSDGRLSGASGSIPAALHTYGGRDLFKLHDGDRIKVDSIKGTIDTDVSKLKWMFRKAHKRAPYDIRGGTQLFEVQRMFTLNPEKGARLPLPGEISPLKKRLIGAVLKWCP